MQGRAIVVGGSIGGLFTAAMLRARGWQAQVYERSPNELAGRGAGIVTHRPLVEVLEACGAGAENLGVEAPKRVGYGPDGNVLEEFDFPQVLTSWDRLQTLTRAVVPDTTYHLGHQLEHYEETDTGVRATFTNGHVAEGDILVGADGFRSVVRGQLFPDIQPEYAGYVCWRGVADEAPLPQYVRDGVFRMFGFHLPPDGEVLGYPIAGPGDDVRVGHRRYNWVWYRVVDPPQLADILTDKAGATHDLSIPPPMIRDEVIARFRADAAERLAPPFRQILDEIAQPFFTPIFDHLSPAMARGRVAMVGDAAVVARPHIGAGVTKAAEDAFALAEALAGNDTIDAAMAAYHDARFTKCRKAYERAQYLGEYLKPKYTNAAEMAEWAAHHNLRTIMRDTAVLNFY